MLIKHQFSDSVRKCEIAGVNSLLVESSAHWNARYLMVRGLL